MKHDLKLRIPSDLKAWLQAKAEDEGRSMNAQVVWALKSAMKADPPCEERPRGSQPSIRGEICHGG
ncbi:hypothetical protein MASR1M32_16310 [Rhodobacter sp.]